MSLDDAARLKRCYACKQSKEVTKLNFGTDRSRYDGLSPMCKPCGKAYSAAYIKSWRLKNPERSRAREREYRKKNAEAYRLLAKKYYHKNKSNMAGHLRFKLARTKALAKIKGLEFSITLDDLNDLLLQQDGVCAISGRKLEIGGRTEATNESQNAISIDRIDNSSGYTKRNIRLVVWAVNVAMRKWGSEAFVDLCKDVVRHSSRKRRK